MLKKIIIIIVIGFVVFIAGSIGAMVWLQSGLDVVSKEEVSTFDLSTIEDGTYKGEYKQGRFSNKVEVTVINHEIKEIKILDDLLFKKEEVTKELLESVKTTQSLDIDMISGATVSCKAYLKAIENALENANNK